MATTYDWYMPTGTGGLKVYCSATQTFVASTTYELQEIQLKLAKSTGQAATTVNIYLYLADGNHKPIGNVLVTIGSITDADLTTTYTWKTFAGLSYTIVEGTEYAIVIIISGEAVCVTGEATNCGVRWQGKSGYANGYGWHKSCALNGAWACSLTWSSPALDWSFKSRGRELPGKPTNPSPSDTASDITLDESPLSWDASDPAANTYEIYFREQGESWDLIGVAQAGIEYVLDFGILDYNITYEWRIDATNAAGTTTGDTWDFDTIVLDPPSPGSDGKNNMITLRRLVVAVENKIWYEDI